jgi:predicted AAA+ superfamily ATPase
MKEVIVIERPEYLSKLASFRDKQLIKIVTGVRRCGKSTLFLLFQEYLAQNGAQAEQIQTINFDDIDNEPLRDYRELHRHITHNLVKDRMNYIFLDEIQNVENFPKTLASLYLKKNVDIYVTGSNAYMFSSKIATLLTGRYIEIKMMPLSFREYMSALPDKTNLPEKYRDYVENSSFPYALQFMAKPFDGRWDKNQIRQYLDSLYNTIVLKDIVERTKVKDVLQLERVIKFMFNNIGKETSINNIVNVMAADKQKVSHADVGLYLNALCDSYVLYQANRYDIRGKKILKTNAKYYAVDMGLRYLLLGNTGDDVGYMLENVVYLELLRRGYEVKIGRVSASGTEKEVDFVADRNGETEYYQVAKTTLLNADTLKRELASLNAIHDHNPKFLLTMDYLSGASHNGIKQTNVLEWLMSPLPA